MTPNYYVDWKPQGEASSEGQVAEQVRSRGYFKPAGKPQRLQNDCMQQFRRARSETSVGIKSASAAKGKKHSLNNIAVKVVATT